MKQKFILSFFALVFTAISACAQGKESVFVNAGNFQHITISSDLDVVLLQATENMQSITMDAGVSTMLGIQFSKNSMTISPTELASKKDFTLFLYVNTLKTLIVENDASVRSMGVLDAPRLELFVGGEAKAHLRTNGVVNAYPLHDTNIRVKYLTGHGLAKQGSQKKI